MHKQIENESLLKKSNIATRLHNAPVFWQYKPINEKARLNLLYRGALLWNGLPANIRNMNYNNFKSVMKKEMVDWKYCKSICIPMHFLTYFIYDDTEF